VVAEQGGAPGPSALSRPEGRFRAPRPILEETVLLILSEGPFDYMEACVWTVCTVIVPVTMPAAPGSPTNVEVCIPMTVALSSM